MTRPIPHIHVCICTYQRPQFLRHLLSELARQNTRGHFTYSVVVVDNDPAASARECVATFCAGSQLRVVYLTEPRRSISHARNLSLTPADGEFVAFIDDDEFPGPDWLFNMHDTIEQFQCAGVLGPVRPCYMDGTPEWIKRGDFFERPEHPTGHVMAWPGCRTGNVLLRRSILAGIDPVFDPAFGTGGSDVDFFRRMTALGHRFLWCNAAPVYEYVPPSRWKRGVLLKRALLRGKNAARHQENRNLGGYAKSVVAILAYGLALPILQLRGHHLLMKYLVKLCNHAGKLLAVCGLNPINERAM